MAKALATWRVFPHGSIEKLSDRLWRIEGELPGMPLKRVMTIARRTDGSLVIHNAVALADEEMSEIDAWGKVATIVVPNGFHRLDAKIFHDRYPAARVVCPAGARAKVAQVVEVAGTYDGDPHDEAVQLEDLDGTKQREGAMIVRDATGTSLVLNDAVFNMPHVAGFTGFVLRRVTGSTGGPRVSRIMRMFVISDAKAFRAHLERLADLPALTRIIVSHHLTIDQDPAATLRAVAATL
ncbi:MAG: hypothetical protein H0T42_18145 [Deltaproteobacteria bacterium]|nr:hypothetical protein [Deltaproteobacteria bacterium]